MAFATALSRFYASSRARAYFVLRKCLSQGVREDAKRLQRTTRTRLNPVWSALYGTYSAGELVANLAARIPADFEILMVHSSYDRLLPMYRGRPGDIIESLLEACGDRRTLVMPSFVLGGRTRDKRQFYKTRPFNVAKTPSEMGLLTEVFRRFKGVKRSLHPTHSICAIGPHAEELTCAHHLANTRTGAGTPFDTMAKFRTVIAGIGVEYFRVLTQTHSAEDLLGDSFPIQFTKETFPVTLVDWAGGSHCYELTVLDTDKILDNTLLRTLLQTKELDEWRYRGTPLFFTSAGVVTSRLVEAARQGITVYR